MSNQDKINIAAKAFGVSPEKLAKTINGIISRKRCYNTRPLEVFSAKNRRLLDKLFCSKSVITPSACH